MAAKARDVLTGFKQAGFVSDNRPVELGKRLAAADLRPVGRDGQLEDSF